MLVAPPLVPVNVVTDPSGRARLPLAVPNQPALLGLSVFAQAVVVDRGPSFSHDLELAFGL